MRKYYFSLIACLFIAISSFAGNPVKIKSGDISVLKNKAIACVEFDYSTTIVEGKNLDEYLKGRGEDVVKDWPSDNVKTEMMFIAKFNSKNDDGLQISKDKTPSYKILVHLTKLDLGNTAAAFLSMSAKGGGAIISGVVDIINLQNNKVECSLSFDELKAISNPSEVIRRGLAYSDLAKYICKLNK